MRYKYIFHSPVKFLIRINESGIEDKEVFINDLQPLIDININDVANKNLTRISTNIKNYINKPGILDMSFTISNGNLLYTIIVFDHVLKRKDFISLFTDIEGQLFAGIGKQFADIPIYKYEDTIEYTNLKGMREKRTVIKNIFCLLWYETNWKLKFINPPKSD